MKQRLTFATEFESKGNRLAGYAAVFNKRTAETDARNMMIAKGAFDNVLDQDVRALFNHDPSLLLGRTSSGTLRLSADSTGLYFDVDLPDTQVGRDVRTLAERGDLNGASFGCVIADWEEGESGLTLITQISDLFDVGPVTFPAFDSTNVELHNIKDSSDVVTKESQFARARAFVIVESTKRK